MTENLEPEDTVNLLNEYYRKRRFSIEQGAYGSYIFDLQEDEAISIIRVKSILQHVHINTEENKA